MHNLRAMEKNWTFYLVPGPGLAEYAMGEKEGTHIKKKDLHCRRMDFSFSYMLPSRVGLTEKFPGNAD